VSQTRVDTLVVDADGHVVETESTWEFMDPSEERYRPVIKLMQPASKGAGNTNEYIVNQMAVEHWYIDGQPSGQAFPKFTPGDLERMSKQTGRSLSTPREAFDMTNVELRVKHMDKVGIDVQVLHNSLVIANSLDTPAKQVAVCRSWNRWM